MVDELTQEAELDKIYVGKVKRITDFGAFVEIFPGTDGLIHISHMAEGRVERVTDVVKEGDEVLAKCIDIDPSGRIRLSRKEALADALRRSSRRLGRADAAVAAGSRRARPGAASRACRAPTTSRCRRYATAGAAGLDLPAAVEGERVLAPGERALVPTGFRIELPAGYEAQVRPAQRAGAPPRHRAPERAGYDRLRLPG